MKSFCGFLFVTVLLTRTQQVFGVTCPPGFVVCLERQRCVPNTYANECEDSLVSEPVPCPPGTIFCLQRRTCVSEGGGECHRQPVCPLDTVYCPRKRTCTSPQLCYETKGATEKPEIPRKPKQATGNHRLDAKTERKIVSSTAVPPTVPQSISDNIKKISEKFKNTGNVFGQKIKEIFGRFRNNNG